MNSFLQWACTEFRVRWLTCWQEDELETLTRYVYLSPQRIGVPLPVYQEWLESKHNGIDWDADFYWVDDAPEGPDLDALKAHGMSDRFIWSDPQGADELVVLRQKLEAILAARRLAAG